VTKVEHARLGYQHIEVRPYSSAVGAELLGVDLSQPLDGHTWAEIRRAFHQYLVLFFRDQTLSPEQHLSFARRFGDLEPYPFVHGIAGYPELIEIVKLPDETRNFGCGWHTDMSYGEQPPLGAVLYGIEVPPLGGDTLFANMYLAYETLSDGMKALVAKLKGLHDSREPEDHSRMFKGMSMMGKKGMSRQVSAHPLVNTHPVTGRNSLYLSPTYCQQLVDMSIEESRPLLDYLERHAVQGALTCRFRWEPGSVAVWDNRCTMHVAISDDLGARLHGQGFRRVMRRATIRC